MMRILTTNAGGELKLASTSALLRRNTEGVPYFGDYAADLAALGLTPEGISAVIGQLPPTGDTDETLGA